MGLLTNIVYSVLLGALAIAVVTDIRSRKVYNWLTFPVMAIGFILNGIKQWPHGLIFSLEGIGVACISLPLFAVTGMGAGDLKLLLAIGALMGPRFMFYTILFTFISGGVLGVCVAVKRKALGYTINNVFIGMQAFAATRSTDSLKGMEAVSKVGKIAYAPAIAIGAAVAAYLIHFNIVLW